jgi:hypothetical protein
VIRGWLRRTSELQRELAAVAEVDPRWWLVAGGAALAEVHAPPEIYLACDAEPDADTFMGHRAPRPLDPIADAIARARAARTAVRELDGALPDQPLAVAIARAGGGRLEPSALDVAAFAIGGACVVGALDDPGLARQLAAVIDGAPAASWRGAMPFVCVSVGDEPLATARHGHRRAWTERGGPWLGLGRAGELAVVSTCHLIVDGYGHARIAARIAELAAGAPPDTGPAHHQQVQQQQQQVNARALPELAPVADGVALAIAWRDLPEPAPRVIPLAYAIGKILHRRAGRPAAPFSPTIQIPVARGGKDDALRLRRRVVAATTSVRFHGGEPEPYAAFEARARDVFAREAAATGLVSRLLAAARAVPVPLAWKRRSISAKRPRWLESFAEVIGGRALISRIATDTAMPHTCAVSSPSRLASAADPFGGCVVTIVDDGARAAITACGSGFVGAEISPADFLDELDHLVASRSAEA